MRKVLLFCEDTGHVQVIRGLLERSAKEQGVEVSAEVRTARGGHGKMLHELKQFVREFAGKPESLPDLLLIARDANCQGYGDCKQHIQKAIGNFTCAWVAAIPDPHVERWLLLDASAFKSVFGKGCSAPDQKCERERYKKLLIQAITDAGVKPFLGGIEYAADLVNAMDLTRLERLDVSLGHLLKDLRSCFNEWKQS
jgi:hypothetical protein